jgi:glutamate/tyrosine decarboxylase-like PLP-dependent enzyme
MIELSPEELGRLGNQVVDFVSRYFAALGDLPVFPQGAGPEKLRRLLDEPLPRQPQGVEAAFADFLDKIVPNSARVGHPRFLGWIRPSPLGAAVYAEALAAALNQSVAVWEGAPAATEVELRVIEWLKEMTGYAPGAAGILTSGGSMANFACLLAARSAADPQARSLGLSGRTPMTIYLTEETHYCVPKAAEMMGLGRQHLRFIPMDDALRMDPQALRAQIRADRAAKLRPMAVAATLGTVNSGACDDLSALGQVCREEGVWLHVDGAYGGLAGLAPEKRYLTAGLEAADSLAFDPHKSLFIPFEAGCALVREPAHLPAAFSMETSYLPNTELAEAWPLSAGADEPGRPAPFHFRDYGPQLTRSFRALKIYLALKTYGVEALAGEISRQYRLAAGLAERIQAAPDFELLAPVTLGIVAFRYRGETPDGSADPEAWLENLNACLARGTPPRGQVFLAGTRIRGRAALRVCFVSYRTREEDLDRILDEVRAAARDLILAEAPARSGLRRNSC